MTATVPRSGPSTSVGGPSLIRRPGIVYGFRILDPATGVVRVDYVGQTVRSLAVREAEHRGLGRDPSCEQPWSDLIVGAPFVVEAGLWTPAELDERERHHIAVLRPRFNFEHNGSNPDRVPIYEARRQRAERDRARGVVSRWTLMADGVAPVPVQQPHVVPVAPAGPALWSRFWRTRAGRWLSAKLRLLGKVVAVWLTAAVVLLLGLAAVLTALHQPVPWTDAAPMAVVAAGLGLAKWWPRRRRRRRAR